MERLPSCALLTKGNVSLNPIVEKKNLANNIFSPYMTHQRNSKYFLFFNLGVLLLFVSYMLTSAAGLLDHCWWFLVRLLL